MNDPFHNGVALIEYPVKKKSLSVYAKKEAAKTPKTKNTLRTELFNSNSLILKILLFLPKKNFQLQKTYNKKG
ncbi:hypothetical protein [Dissulfurispira thermophila]|uniref:hypothetical protein n=1 Tax=Dissulfurispira thermophila TaxID=2715679 RepID=UPI00193E17F3|nr:hypothetical protein [Dissulfurispira thermophila]